MPLTAKDVNGLRVAELKDECRARGLKVSGVKQELVDRLKAHLRTQVKAKGCLSKQSKQGTSAMSSSNLGSEVTLVMSTAQESDVTSASLSAVAPQIASDQDSGDDSESAVAGHAEKVECAVDACPELEEQLHKDKAIEMRTAAIAADLESQEASESVVVTDAGEADAAVPILTELRGDVESRDAILEVGAKEMTSSEPDQQEGGQSYLGDSIEEEIKVPASTMVTTTLEASHGLEESASHSVTPETAASEGPKEDPSRCEFASTMSSQAHTQKRDDAPEMEVLPRCIHFEAPHQPAKAGAVAESTVATKTKEERLERSRSPPAWLQSVPTAARGLSAGASTAPAKEALPEAASSLARSEQTSARSRSPARHQDVSCAGDHMTATPSKFSGILERMKAKAEAMDRGEGTHSSWTPRPSPLRRQMQQRWQTPPRGLGVSAESSCADSAAGSSCATGLVAVKVEAVEGSAPAPASQQSIGTCAAPSTSSTPLSKKHALLEEKKQLLQVLTDKLQVCLRRLQDRTLDDKNVEKYQDLAKAIRKQMDTIVIHGGPERSPAFPHSPAFARSPAFPYSPASIRVRNGGF